MNPNASSLLKNRDAGILPAIQPTWMAKKRGRDARATDFHAISNWLLAPIFTQSKNARKW